MHTQKSGLLFKNVSPTTYSESPKNIFKVIIRSIVAITALCAGLLSCQKTIAWEDGWQNPTDGGGGGTQSGTAVFTVAGAPGVCPEIVLVGDYFRGKPVGDTCHITITVNVTDTGTYAIATNAVNGVTFAGSGTFTATGTQTIQLKAAGTPATAGVISYTAGKAGCTFTVTVVDPDAIPAEFTLSGSPNACTLDTVKGIYNTTVPLDTSNTVMVTAVVTKAGTYNITTPVVNGIKFSASGRFEVGTQTVVLAGSGTPTAAGTNSYSTGANGCTFPVTVTVPPPAVFTLSGSPAACSAAVVNGTYQVGVALTTDNTVTIQVDVTATGAFLIVVPTVNGMSFSAVGKFTATGTNVPVTLRGSGTPLTEETSTFSPAAGATTCTFAVPVGAAPPPPTGTFNCKIDGAALSFDNRGHAETLNDPLSGGPYLYLDGYTGPPNGGSVPEMQIFINNNDNSAIQPGTYDEKHIAVLNGYRIEIDYHGLNNDGSTTIWNTSSNFLSVNPPFVITVTEVTATRIKGTFSGKLTNTLQGSTITKTVTDGTFDLPIVN